MLIFCLASLSIYENFTEKIKLAVQVHPRTDLELLYVRLFKGISKPRTKLALVYLHYIEHALSAVIKFPVFIGWNKMWFANWYEITAFGRASHGHDLAARGIWFESTTTKQFITTEHIIRSITDECLYLIGIYIQLVQFHFVRPSFWSIVLVTYYERYEYIDNN